MPRYERTKQKKPGGNAQKHNTTRSSSNTLVKQFHSGQQHSLPVDETPFQPRIKKHLDMITKAGSAEERANVMSYLQQSYGNRYVQSLVESIEVQAKLNISQPGDFQEQQADRVAEIVTRVVETEIQRQPEEEEEIPQIIPLQRQIEEEEEVPSPPEEEEIQTRLLGNQSASVSESLEKRINNAQGSGEKLSEIAREPTERTLGVDFHNVHVHTDAEADDLNKSLQARAFTRGHDIFFRQGEYNPSSKDGRKLLAHELTHVAQQTRGGDYVNRLQETLDLKVDQKLPGAKIIAEPSSLSIFRDAGIASDELSINKKLPVMTLPDPATMGGVVTVKSQKFEAWISPTAPACVAGGIQAHEAKHISDFEADSYYSTIPKSGKIADGHCVYYANNADAKKFENAAIDVETNWLKKKLESKPSEADKKIIENRMNVTLPAYRASFG